MLFPWGTAWCRTPGNPPSVNGVECVVWLKEPSDQADRSPSCCVTLGKSLHHSLPRFNFLYKTKGTVKFASKALSNAKLLGEAS